MNYAGSPKAGMDGTDFILEGGVLIPVSYTQVASYEGNNPKIYVVRKGGFVVNKEDLISVKESSIPENHAKIVLSTDTDITGFTFYVNLSYTEGMTLAQQSNYIKQRARIEFVRTLHHAGLRNLIYLVNEIKDIHLHELLESGKICYACDHKH